MAALPAPTGPPAPPDPSETNRTSPHVTRNQSHVATCHPKPIARHHMSPETTRRLLRPLLTRQAPTRSIPQP
eukprot:6750630-Pyramimonas_sp.AAC.1